VLGRPGRAGSFGRGAEGDVSGDDADAKALVAALLRDFGWSGESIVDLGGIRSARGPEHYFLMFAAFMQSLGKPSFNIRLVT